MKKIKLLLLMAVIVISVLCTACGSSSSNHSSGSSTYRDSDMDQMLDTYNMVRDNLQNYMDTH